MIWEGGTASQPFLLNYWLLTDSPKEDVIVFGYVPTVEAHQTPTHLML